MPLGVITVAIEPFVFFGRRGENQTSVQITVSPSEYRMCDIVLGDASIIGGQRILDSLDS